MKKFLLIFIFLISSCSYQPIYVNKSLKNIEFSKITTEGDADINRKITLILSFIANNIGSPSISLFFAFLKIRINQKNKIGHTVNKRILLLYILMRLALKI